MPTSYDELLNLPGSDDSPAQMARLAEAKRAELQGNGWVLEDEVDDEEEWRREKMEIRHNTDWLDSYDFSDENYYEDEYTDEDNEEEEEYDDADYEDDGSGDEDSGVELDDDAYPATEASEDGQINNYGEYTADAMEDIQLELKRLIHCAEIMEAKDDNMVLPRPDYTMPVDTFENLNPKARYFVDTIWRHHCKDPDSLKLFHWTRGFGTLTWREALWLRMFVNIFKGPNGFHFTTADEFLRLAIDSTTPPTVEYDIVISLEDASYREVRGIFYTALMESIKYWSSYSEAADARLEMTKQQNWQVGLYLGSDPMSRLVWDVAAKGPF